MPVTDQELLSLPAGFELQPGFHAEPGEGMCALEAVAWIAGLPHSDHPSGVCPVFTIFLRTMNDRMTHLHRQRLIPFLPRIVGSQYPDMVLPRARALAWRAMTVFAPIPLASAGLFEPAGSLSRLSRRDPEAAKSALETASRAVNDAAWAEAEAKGAKFWDVNVEVSPAMWTAVEATRLARIAHDQLAADDEGTALAKTAAKILALTCKFDNAAWSLALDALDELLAIGAEDATVVRLDDYRRSANRAA